MDADKKSKLLHEAYEIRKTLLETIQNAGSGHIGGSMSIAEDVYKRQRLVRIVVPLIKPTTLYVSITCVINSMQVFDQVMIITGGGPARSSSVMVQYLYENAFDYYKMGYASAIGWIMALFIFILSLVQFRTMGNDDYSIE